eukprot:Phypoly_transcript_07825.p1 GENE.Phypoly_transcript_07825~~Phypoly_transcript_07825.p1  ORF type:complete len:520 (+),score=56.44 Phypoly_transcript_07825:83-1561(+)
MDILRELHQVAATFYEQAPWFLLSSDNVIEIINLTNDKHKVLQVCGNSFNDTGLMMWKSHRDFKRILVPGMSQIDAILKGEVYQTLFHSEVEAENELKQQYLTHNLPCATVGGVRFFADICLLAQRKASKEEKEFMYAGLSLIPIFVNKHMVREGFNSWKPVEKKFNLSNGPGSSQKTLYMLRYPAEGKRITFGERRLGPVPSNVEPIRWESVEEAHEYFKTKLAESERKLAPELFQTKGLLAKAPGGRQHLSYMKGLADTFWKLQQTDKATETAYKMLFYDPTDTIQVTDMIIDFVLELGRFDEVMALLTREDFETPLTLWTSTLVDFVKFGGDHATTQKALLQALKHHPHVLSIIIGVRSLPRDMGDFSTVLVGERYTPQHGLQGNFIYAAHYCKNFAKYWRNVPGAVDWLKDYGQKLLAKINEPGGKTNMQSFPKPNLMVCFNCHTHKEKGLLKCGGCKRATYCDKECQKAHWKEHKPQCIAIPNTKLN